MLFLVFKDCYIFEKKMRNEIEYPHMQYFLFLIKIQKKDKGLMKALNCYLFTVMSLQISLPSYSATIE